MSVRKLLSKPKIINVDEISYESEISSQEDNVTPVPILNRYYHSSHLQVILNCRKGNKTAVTIEVQDDAEKGTLVVKVKEESSQDRLKIIALAKRTKKELRNENIQQCSICLSDLKDKEQIGELPCKHSFCLECIKKASKYSNKCPYCRSLFRQITNGMWTIPVPQPQYQQPDDDDPCYICGRNDNLHLLMECDYCQYTYCHSYCDSRLESQELPTGAWYCESCTYTLQQHPSIEQEANQAQNNSETISR